VMMNIFHRHVSYIKLGPHWNVHAVCCRNHKKAGTEVVISVTVGVFK